MYSSHWVATVNVKLSLKNMDFNYENVAYMLSTLRFNMFLNFRPQQLSPSGWDPSFSGCVQKYVWKGRLIPCYTTVHIWYFAQMDSNFQIDENII